MVKTASVELKKAPKLNLKKLNHDLAVATKEMAFNKLSRRQIEQNKRKERLKELSNPIYIANSHQVETVQDKPPQCRERS